MAFDLKLNFGVGSRVLRIGDEGALAGLSDLYVEAYIPVNEMVEDVSAFPAVATRQATTLQSAHYDHFACDDSANEYAYFTITVPEDMDGTNARFSACVHWEGAAS